MSNASAYRDDAPCCNRTSHHQRLTTGEATPTWFGTMSTSTPSPAACAALDEFVETLVAAARLIDLAMVDHVVAVVRPRLRA